MKKTKIQDSVTQNETPLETPAETPEQIIPTPKELNEAVTALATAPARGADGRWISKKSTEFETQRKEHVENAITDAWTIVQSGDYEVKDGDSLNVQMIKSICRGVITASDEKGGLAAKAKAWEIIMKAIGLGTVDRPKAEENTFQVCIVDPFSGMSAEERAEALAKAVEWRPPATKTRPSFADATPAVASAETIDPQYVDNGQDSYHPAKPRGSA